MNLKQNQYRFGKVFALMAIVFSILGVSNSSLAAIIAFDSYYTPKEVGHDLSIADWNRIGETLNGVSYDQFSGNANWGFGVASNASYTISTGSGISVGGILDVTGLTTLNGGLTIQDGDTFTYATQALTTLSLGVGDNGALVTQGYVDDEISTANLFTKSGIIISNGGSGADYATDDFVFGSPSLDDDTDADHDYRMFFDKSKAAFRAGMVMGSEWDDANIGMGSFAAGGILTASGTGSVAMGVNNISSGDYSFVAGSENTIEGDTAFAFGNNISIHSDANYAIAMGRNVIIGPDGTDAVAMGHFARALKPGSIAIGVNSTSGGDAGIAIGYATLSSGALAVSIGNNTTAHDYSEITMGRYNVIGTGSATAWNTADNLFVIGNGSDPGNRSNALTILKSGKTTINAPEDEALLTIAPTGGTALAIATTGYIDGAITASAGTVPQEDLGASGDLEPTAADCNEVSEAGKMIYVYNAATTTDQGQFFGCVQTGAATADWVVMTVFNQ